MDNSYDTIIIGAGVAGLAFANYSLELNPKQKILIIEKDKVIGGCHKVNRQKFNDEYYFSEHGPRVYINNYVNFIHLLKKMNLDFYELFFKSFSFNQISQKIIIEGNNFTFGELLYLTRDFFFVIFVNTHGIDTSMKDYMNNNNFSEKTKTKIDLLCRSFDGGDSSRISLNQFISFSIQSSLYSAYTPKKPNDEGLFKYWRKFLELNKVKFILNNGIKELFSDETKKEITKITLEDGTEINGKQFIFAFPPENLIELLNKNSNDNIKNAFGNFNDLQIMTDKTKYDEYISMSFHWDTSLELIDDIDKFNIETEWGLITSTMTKGMKFKESKSKTVISCAIILTDKKGSITNKTANECETKEELFKEVFEQLKLLYKNLPEPSVYFINNYYDKKQKKWASIEESYIKVPNIPYMPFESIHYKNLFTLGTHNGKHKNSFTSLESAISNSIKLANIIYKPKRKIRIRRCFDLRDLIIVILSIIILLLLIRYSFYYKK